MNTILNDVIEFRTAFDQLMFTARHSDAMGSNTKFPYQRSSAPSKESVRKAAQRQKARAKEKTEAAKGCRPLTSGFVKILPTLMAPTARESEKLLSESGPEPGEIPTDVETNGRELAKKDLERRLKSKCTSMSKQNHNRHLAVLHFMNYREQILKSGKQESRLATALNVSQCFGRGKWYAEKVISWEKKWIV